MKKFIIYLIFIFSNVLIAQTNNNLIFKESIYTVEIKIDNGKDYLELDKENKIEIITKNIDMTSMACSGKNLSRGLFSNDENSIKWKTTVKKEHLKDGFYHLYIRFKGRKGKIFTHEFLIAVK